MFLEIDSLRKKVNSRSQNSSCKKIMVHPDASKNKHIHRLGLIILDGIPDWCDNNDDDHLLGKVKVSWSLNITYSHQMLVKLAKS